VLKKKIWANFQRNIELFTQKIVNKLSKLWIWDPGSGIRDPGSEIRDPGSGKNLFRIPDPGVKKAPDPGSRIRIRNTGRSKVECHAAKWGMVQQSRVCSSKVECFAAKWSVMQQSRVRRSHARSSVEKWLARLPAAKKVSSSNFSFTPWGTYRWATALRITERFSVPKCTVTTGISQLLKKTPQNYTKMNGFRCGTYRRAGLPL
jgi:hypothetical protein